MKAVILAGGLGTRLSEETDARPKTMVLIGSEPILWHIMKIYSHYGIHEFIICLGYKGYYIKEYFATYYLRKSNVTINLRNNEMTIHKNPAEPWIVTMIDTGLHTMTGARIKRVQEYLENETFFLSYGDGLTDLNLADLLKFHRSHGKLCTMTSTQPAGRYGVVEISENLRVKKFTEKPKGEGGWINAGYFVCEPGVLNYISNDSHTVFEKEPLENLAKDGELYAYKHEGFWQGMDTLNDKRTLEEMWFHHPQWKVWED